METLTPQQTEFLAYYLDPTSETFANAMQSAIRAKYAREYAENITHIMPKWLSENIGQRDRMLMKAEKRLENTLESQNENLAQDTAKFLAETLGKKKGYSKRTELTGSEGKDLTINILEFNAKGSNNPT